MIAKPLRLGFLLLLGLGILAALAAAEPITGPEFDLLLEVQNIPLQRELEQIFPESEGYLVTGPLDPMAALSEDTDASPYGRLRVVCPNLEAQARAERQAAETKPRYYATTIHQLRWLIWARQAVTGAGSDTNAVLEYSVALWHYLHDLDLGDQDAVAPLAAAFGLPEAVDFYAPVPDYVIQGYVNYKAYLREYAEIKTDFATGVLAFVPTRETIAAMQANAPRAAYPNQEAAALQHEFREFFARGGNLRVIRTLTAESFAELGEGEYFFGVNVSGKVRFGKELLREEIDRIEAETGHKAPRANHAFLFPGEPLLTAGAFFVSVDPEPRIREVVANSGHYFYSNIVPTIREDVAEQSDTYLSTLGHFFRVLDSLGIPYDGVLIRKF